MMNKIQLRRALSGAACALAIGGTWLAAGVSTPAWAQAGKAAQFRVGELIKNGFLGEPTDWTLKGFKVDKGSNISRKGQGGGWGTATTPFLGPDGFYKIRVRYLDEGDGVSTARLSVGGRDVGSWQFDGILINADRWKEFDHVAIKKGDEITLSGRAGGYEYCRIIGMEILPSTALPVVAQTAALVNKEYSTNLVPVPANTKYTLKPGLFFSGGSGAYWVYLEKNKPLRLTAWPGRAGGNPSLQYSLTKTGAEKPAAAETLVAQSAMALN